MSLQFLLIVWQRGILGQDITRSDFYFRIITFAYGSVSMSFLVVKGALLYVGGSVCYNLCFLLLLNPLKFYTF